MTSAGAGVLVSPPVRAAVGTVRAAALWALLGAGLLGSWGVGWDIRWHLWVGRDSFWIPPHLVTYAAVAAGAALSLGVLGLETWQARRGRRPVGAVRVAGLVGTPGFHVAWWGIAVTILAAPVDELWHRLFGLDVTLWSPPHLLGFAGAEAHGVGCLMIARERWPPGSPIRLAALWVGGTLLLGHLLILADQAVQVAFRHGGPAFFTYAALAAFLGAFGLGLASRLAARRATPVVLAAGALVLQLTVLAVADAGFAVARPESSIDEVIARDPDSSIAVAHEMARRSGAARPGRSLALRWLPLAAAVAMAVADPRRRPRGAALAFGLTLAAVSTAHFLRAPALAHATPAAADAALALPLVAAAALAGGEAAARLADLIQARSPR